MLLILILSEAVKQIFSSLLTWNVRSVDDVDVDVDGDVDGGSDLMKHGRERVVRKKIQVPYRILQTSRLPRFFFNCRFFFSLFFPCTTTYQSFVSKPN